jgi:hypothetical protein
LNLHNDGSWAAAHSNSDKDMFLKPLPSSSFSNFKLDNILPTN